MLVGAYAKTSYRDQAKILTLTVEAAEPICAKRVFAQAT